MHGGSIFRSAKVQVSRARAQFVRKHVPRNVLIGGLHDASKQLVDSTRSNAHICAGMLRTNRSHDVRSRELRATSIKFELKHGRFEIAMFYHFADSGIVARLAPGVMIAPFG